MIQSLHRAKQQGENTNASDDAELVNALLTIQALQRAKHGEKSNAGEDADLKNAALTMYPQVDAELSAAAQEVQALQRGIAARLQLQHLREGNTSEAAALQALA